MSDSGLSPPFLKTVTLLPDEVVWDRFPFDRFGFLKTGDFKLAFPTPVTFFIGENGAGKSTVLEAIAKLCGFHLGGGGSDHQLHETSDRSESVLADCLRPSWLPKVSKGFFFRSDTFTDVARYLDEVGNPGTGGGHLHEQSHGESPHRPAETGSPSTVPTATPSDAIRRSPMALGRSPTIRGFRTDFVVFAPRYRDWFREAGQPDGKRRTPIGAPVNPSAT